ncbi:MAG: preprotein translocase subunit SecY [Spirochaetales bacterium]|nr:preprotein translocase subunit SecY [Spirochaetales bacterium]
MSNALSGILKIKELRNRVLYTIFMLILFRIGAQIPVPGVNLNSLELYLQSSSNSNNPFMEYFNFFAGGAFENLSLFALGIMPYITTSIILQLLMLIVPGLKRVAEEEGGRKKISQFTRIGTVPVCFIQSFLTINLIKNYENSAANIIAMEPKLLFYFSTVIITTVGTLILMWMGERITEKGIGNGISLIIFAGIVARMPGALGELFNKVSKGALEIPVVLFIVIMFVFIIALVIYEQQGQRKIPINYAKRIVGRKMYGNPNTTYLPLKINPSGVMPIIFASSLLAFPHTLASVFNQVSFFRVISNALNGQSVVYMIVYSILIIFFAYFYTQVTLNPVEIAKNIRENGGTIPGVPVNKVEEYLTKVLNRIVLPGSIFLALIAIIPSIIINMIPEFPSSMAYLLGGTSLIIIVGVDLDTMSQVEGYLKMYHYDGIVKKGKIRSRNF